MSPQTLIIDPEGEELLPISALNDLLYCQRRCWLHRVAGLDAENVHTLSGAFEHQRVDEPALECRPGLRTERALPLVSRSLGLVGRADVVEFHQETDGLTRLYPVDYKHGPRRKWDNDDVQLCAQAMCLMEMSGQEIPAGAIFHVKSKRRREVIFTPQLQAQVRSAAASLHQLMRTQQPPRANLKPQCDGCAMRTHCLPEADEANERLDLHVRALFDVGDSV